MTEYAPQAITDLFNSIKAGIPSAQMAGIIGDSAHTYGYHRGRNYVPSSDYSVCQNPADRKGDGEAACALDISWSKASDQYTVSKRLLNAKNNAAVTKCLRSFFGSTDGVNVCGWDYYYGCSSTSDDSHLWHVHLSITRQYANDSAALQAIVPIITGGAAPPAPEPEDDMGTFKTTVCKETQALTNSWRTLAMDDDGNQSWVWGPCAFQAQANVTIQGLPPGGATARFRWATYDVRSSDGYTKPDPVNTWPDIEVVGTSGGTYGQVMQLGQIGKPASGYSRRLRLQGYSDAASGVSLSYLRTSLFSQ